MSTDLPPLHSITKDDKGAILTVSSYAWAAATVVTAICRLLLTTYRNAKLQSDDITFYVAVVLAIATSVIYHLATNAGLGSHEDSLSSSELTNFFKFLYTAQLMGILTMACGKLSAVLLNKRVDNRNPRKIQFLLASTAGWAIFSFFATAFQCKVPETWLFRPSNCPTRGYLQYVVIATNMLTDVLIVVIVIPSLYGLNMSLTKRSNTIAVFSTRLLAPAVAIGSIAYLSRVITSSDQTWANIPRTLFDQAVIHLSVMLSTLPRVSRLLTGLRDDLTVPLVSHQEVSDLAKIESARTASIQTSQTGQTGQTGKTDSGLLQSAQQQNETSNG